MTSPFLEALRVRPWPLVMGVINVTPDSFSDGGHHATMEAARDHGLALAAAGADILDVGGESTRPGATPVPVDEELARVLPVIESLRAATAIPISIDTRNPAVAAAAIAAGASAWNDVSALSHAPDSLDIAVALQVPVILMHALGDPQTMQNAPAYRDVTGEVLNHLVSRFGAAVRAGLPPSHILVDPGIGFGKTLEHNLTLLGDLKRLVALGRPLVLGVSRKRFIAHIDGGDPATDARLGGSVAAAIWGASQGAAIVRVHDVHDTLQALKVWRAINTPR
jgi:dihydropteroate synthase